MTGNRKTKEKTKAKNKNQRSGLLKTVGLVGLASAMTLASPGSAELTKASKNLSLLRETAREGRQTGHMVLDGVLSGLRSAEAAAVCHTDSHSSSHTSGGGTDNHTSSRKRVLHQC